MAPAGERITRERVLAEALRLADAEGAEHLSMRKLGRACGVEAMSLYHHVPDKSAVLDGINELVYREMQIPEVPPDTSWRDELKLLACVVFNALVAHPGAITVVATRPTITPDSLRLNERALRLLREAGFSLREAHHVANTIMAFTIGFALAVAGRSALVPEQRSDREPQLPAASEHDYPLTAETIRRCQQQEWYWAETFDVALRAIIAGAEAIRGRDDAAPREEGRRREVDARTGGA